MAKSNKLTSIVFQIASHSKASTKSRFWNRSFHILSCNHNMKSTASTSRALDKSNSENSSCRLDRKASNGHWSRCNWQQSFLVAVIVALLNLTSVKCLQARQEGECAKSVCFPFNIQLYLIT